MHLSRLNATVENIRNIRSKDRVYPSDVLVEGVVFDSGRFWLRGQADFLADPHPGLLAQFRLDQIELDYFRPVTNRVNLSVRNGTLTAVGSTEYSPKFRMAVLEHVLVEAPAGGYRHHPPAAEGETGGAQTPPQGAQSGSHEPSVQLKIDRPGNLGANPRIQKR